MKICIPRVEGRGAGLGNELIPWAKAFIASQELGTRLFPPTWGLNHRRYRRYFGTSRFDWMLPHIFGTLLPKYTLTEADYRDSGKIDFGAAVRVFAERKGLAKKGAYVLFVEGMWGGYKSICRARDFLYGMLHGTRYTQANLYDLRRHLDGSKLHVAVHVRRGDFDPTESEHDYRGRFNITLPLQWYLNVCRSLRAALGDDLIFLLFSDEKEASLAKFIAEFNPVTTFVQRNTDCSDLLAMATADLLICSVSSYSMWAASLSGKPYLWFRPNLQEHDGFLSIWGHEAAQAAPNGMTARNIAALRFDKNATANRGHPVDLNGTLPVDLVHLLREALKLKITSTDLIFYGAVPADN